MAISSEARVEHDAINPFERRMDLVRLAIPRRVYTQSHIDYVVEAILEVSPRRESIRGFKLAYQAPFLRLFTARFTGE